MSTDDDFEPWPSKRFLLLAAANYLGSLVVLALALGWVMR